MGFHVTLGECMHAGQHHDHFDSCVGSVNQLPFLAHRDPRPLKGACT